MTEKYPNIGGYVYCLQNPVKFVDPDGRNPLVIYRVVRIVQRSYRVSRSYQRIKDAENMTFTEALWESFSGNQFVTGDKSEEVANSLIDRANLESTTSDARKATPEELKEAKRREKAAAKEAVETIKKHNKMIQDNLPDPDLDDGGGPKRELTDKEKVIFGTVSAIGIMEQALNPKPSMDAHDAHMEYIQDKKQDPNKKSIYWIDWIKKLNQD